MKTMKFLSLAALALTFAACSNDENEVIQQQAGQPADGEITITATITKDDDMTRALSVDGSNIASTWTVGEKVAIIFEYKSAKTVREAEVKSVTGRDAYIQFTIPADLADSQTATLVYPATAVNATKDGADVATALATQDGSITNCPEVRTGTGTLYTSPVASLTGGFLGAQNAIFKFTVQDLSSTNKTATEFKVSDASGNVLTTVTASPASSALYVALPVMASGTYWFNATIGGKPYIAKATLSSVTAAGKYYQSTVKMATVGDVILSDGKFAAPSSTGSKVAMIAYLGSETDHATYKHGLAIQLNASPESKNWNDAKTYASGLTAVPGGTWRLPSKADWQNMFVGCAKSGDAISPDGDGKMEPIAGFKEKIGATGITWELGGYWSSTGSGSDAWCVDVYLDGSDALAGFFEEGTSTPFNVRACLAF